MEKIGAQLATVQNTHDTAIARLSTGRGNLVGQAQTLKKLGARATKQIDIDHDGDDDLLPPPDTPS
jgi:DNA recombination protein RmuC